MAETLFEKSGVTMSINTRLQNVFESVFGPGISILSHDDSPNTIKGWDSINHLNLILALEAEFGVQFAANEIASLVSVGEIQKRIFKE
jgi:acyl carrier protein